MNSEPVIEMNEVRVSHPRSPGVALLEGVNWRVNPGEFWVVAGLQGSGKTVLMETAAGLFPQIGGEVRIFGRQIYGAGPDDTEIPATRLRLGLVFEGGGRLFPSLTVLENVALPWSYHGNRPTADATRALGPLIEYMRLDKLLDQSPGRLGRSWARRVALARAMAIGPELLLLDNPLSGLDTAHLRWWRTFLADVVRGHPAWGGRPLTVVISSDELRPLLPVAQRFALAHDGRWRILGSADDVMAVRNEDGVRDVLGESD